MGEAGRRGHRLRLSAPALEAARDLAQRAGMAARFVEGELYDASKVLANQSYDVVYTGVGALNWLPDVTRWAHVVAALLALARPC